MKAPLYREIDNKVKAKYKRLFNEGFYLRPCVFDNCIEYQLVKDINPVNCRAYRKFHGVVNYHTAMMLKKYWGFVIRNKVLYFGKGEPVGNWEIRTYC